MERRAKIMATLGPASSSDEVISQMLDAGLDVVRLNLSHGSHDSHRTLINIVRRQAADQGRFIPIVLDLMGPRYRLGDLPDGSRRLDRGQTLRLVAEPERADDLPLGRAELVDLLGPGDRVLVDSGLIELEVTERTEGSGGGVLARVLQGGSVSSRKGINLPDSDLPFEISDKDRNDIAFAVAEGLDYLAASYVQRADDLEALRAISRDAGAELPLIAKLERQGSIDRLPELVEGADALMVARGDLGVEVPLHRVPVLQKEIIAAGRRQGKPVIVATQMLESMMTQPRPTRAEASDVANAVFDGADALMLSGETAAGDYPVDAVRVMTRIIGEAEKYEQGTGPMSRSSRPWETLGLDRPCDGDRSARAESDAAEGEAETEPLAIAEIVSAAAVYAADRLPVRQIVAFSQGGFTARMISRSRPGAPILVFTTDAQVARRIQLVWGVRPLLMDTEAKHHDEVVDVVERQLLKPASPSPARPSSS